ncbi:hypothetical protein P9112_010811 [Eukaryota sp. TZLM1-RC]
MSHNADLCAAAHVLGFSLHEFPALAFIVELFLTAPLPPHWVEFLDENDDVFYYDSLNDETTRKHPAESYYRDIVSYIITTAPNQSLDHVDIKSLPIHLQGQLQQLLIPDLATTTLTPSDVTRASQMLGINTHSEPHLLWIVKDLLSDPLPEGWSLHSTSPYWTWKRDDGTVSLTHPDLATFNHTVTIFRNLSDCFPFEIGSVDSAWMEFGDGEYFFNFITKQKSLTLPVSREWLIQRPSIAASALESLEVNQKRLIDRAIDLGERYLNGEEMEADQNSEEELNIALDFDLSDDVILDGPVKTPRTLQSTRKKYFEKDVSSKVRHLARII